MQDVVLFSHEFNYFSNEILILNLERLERRSVGYVVEVGWGGVFYHLCFSFLLRHNADIPIILELTFQRSLTSVAIPMETS